MTAVVVHYRGGELARRCVESCLAIERIDEVVLVDNEGVGERLRRDFAGRRVRVVDMGRNAGFGTAANAGADLARGEAVLILNQDVVLTAATLDEVMARGERAGAWIAAPLLLDLEDRAVSRKTSFPRPLRWSAPGPPPDGCRFAPYVVGAVMVLMPGHTDLRFDERFFMYGEDIDICWNVWARGGCVVEACDASALHVGGTATSTRWSPRMSEYRVLVANGRFVRKVAGWGGALRYARQLVSTALRANYPGASIRPSMHAGT